MGLISMIADVAKIRGGGDKMKEAMLRATREAVVGATEQAKLEIREQVRSAGLGNRLPNAIRAKIWPADGRLAYNPGGSIFGKGKSADDILTAFSQGVTIQRKNGKFLAIPTEQGKKLLGGKRGGPEMALQRLQRVRVGRGKNQRTVINRVELDIIPIRGPGIARAAIITRGATIGQSGNVRAATVGRARQGLKEQAVVLFWLVPRVRIRKRLDPQMVLDRALASMEDRTAQAVLKQLGNL